MDYDALQDAYKTWTKIDDMGEKNWVEKICRQMMQESTTTATSHSWDDE